MDDEIPEYLYWQLWEKCYEDFHEDLCDRVMRLSLDRFAVVVAHALEAMRYGEARAIMNDLEIKGEVVQGLIGRVWVEARKDRNVTLLLAKGFVDRMIAHDAGRGCCITMRNITRRAVDFFHGFSVHYYCWTNLSGELEQSQAVIRPENEYEIWNMNEKFFNALEEGPESAFRDKVDQGLLAP